MGPAKPLSAWLSRLSLKVDKSGCAFELSATVYDAIWLPLPGGKEAWPIGVRADGNTIPVLERDGRPAIQLPKGTHRIDGTFPWNEIPQKLSLPQEIGILNLSMEGRPVDIPVWDAQGTLWLKRGAATEETDKDFLSVKAYGLLEDGIPLWLRTEVELSVSGKSREEEIGGILPEGWSLSAVESPIPVAIDSSGKMKAQVRAGKWRIIISAFRIDNPAEFHFSKGTKPVATEELIAFRSKPDFRMVEILGAQITDVSQTTFPAKWREYPVYLWNTAVPFHLEERLRGMGPQKPAVLHISREFWLDEDGLGLTYRDHISGTMQSIWRLDAAEGQDLGSVRTNRDGQLITRDPANGAPGVEIRTGTINLDATGRMGNPHRIPATGWRADADELKVTMNLPPGWRLFALFGADWVSGDWLTEWSLLDLFLLLLFTLAVGKLFGIVPAILAFLAFGISYHEPGAPRYIWLALLIPIALLRVVPAGWGKTLLNGIKWALILVLVLSLAPFIAQQVQQTLYPQLEHVGSTTSAYTEFHQVAGEASLASAQSAAAAEPTNVPPPSAPASFSRSSSPVPSDDAFSKSRTGKNENLFWDNKAKIQTGPGLPDWRWRTVRFGWNGPVHSSQSVHAILISLTMERAISLVRIAFLLLLGGILINARSMAAPFFRGKSQAAATLLAGLLIFPSAHAQFPDQQMLETLKKRILEPADAYPNAADIPYVSLSLNDRKLSMDVEVHTAMATAVPLPGKLQTWSPVTITVDGTQTEPSLRRMDGYIWISLSEGVHKIHIEGLLPESTEWEWTFQLKPHRVSISAPGWAYSGVHSNGTPDQQVFFTLKQKIASAEAFYDRQDFLTLTQIERKIELGLVWQVKTTVRRLSKTGKALSLRIPLLPGENVISSNAIVKENFIEVRLGAQDPAFSWESELPVTSSLLLSTKKTNSWVETWDLVASPVWNVSFQGLAPIFETSRPELVPVWHPWPGENVTLSISRPDAIAGATVTVGKVTHTITLGHRQNTSQLDISLQCSLGEDLPIALPKEARITSVSLQGRQIPIRSEAGKLIVPLSPGEQSINITWKSDAALGFRSTAGQIRLPVESANIRTIIEVSADRWILGAQGPLRGPAVRFWGILACSLLAAWLLGRTARSPLRCATWMLLAIGLTQVPLPFALIVIGWFFILSWRGTEQAQSLPGWAFNIMQLAIIGLTFISIGIFIGVVTEGLLGSPEMFITGNGSSRLSLRWYQARSGNWLPEPLCFSVSIWFYRFFMLAWALWIATSLIGWLQWAWNQFSTGKFFATGKKSSPTPPPIPL